MATGATEYIDATTADAFIAEIWSKEAIVAREQTMVFADVVNRDFEGELSYGDTVHVPSVTNLSTVTKSRSANAAITYETQTETNTDLVVDTWIYSAFALETATKRQTRQDLVKRYAPKQGYAVSLKVDADLAALPDDFATNIVGVLGTPLSYSDWLRAQQYLDDANVPLDDRSMIIAPAERKNLMEMDQFVNGDFSKLQDRTAPAKDRARIGTWMTIPVWMSTHVEGSNAAGHDNTLLHREALALAIQIDMPSHYFFDIDYLAHKYVVECLYGVKEMRDDHGVWARGA